jgi:peptide/nickel transport system permease protein
MLRHVLPNCVAPILILTSGAFGWAILVESSLSFLGLGVPPNIPSWGAMLGGQAQQYVRSAPWTALFPGLVLSIAVLAANLLGDTLRDVLDPRMGER